MPFFAWICALILAAAAAAAAALFLTPALAGLLVASRGAGLRSRCDSDSLRVGDRERRSVSKRERGARSGSSLSKRDRGRRSSDMVGARCWVWEGKGSRRLCRRLRFERTRCLCRARLRQLGPIRQCAVCRRMPDVGAEHGISGQWTDSGDMSPLAHARRRLSFTTTASPNCLR
jgi:hypothetical protein